MFKKAYALIVGIGNYKHVGGLHFSARDAEGIYNTLTGQCGYYHRNVRLLLDEEATKTSIMENMDWLATVSKAYDEATALIYFAGHGLEWLKKKPSCYLCPHETEVKKLKATAISESEFSEALRNIEGKLVVFLDACHSEGAAQIREGVEQPGDTRAGFPDSYYERLRQGGQARAILAASQISEGAWEYSELEHGVFTHFLLKGLRGEASPQPEGIDILDLFQYMRAGVSEFFRSRGIAGVQNPVFEGHVSHFIVGLHRHKSEHKPYLEFANRVQELNSLRRVDGVDMIIDAPAGYGKSRLLKEGEKWYKEGHYMDDAPSKTWKCILVNLEECPYHSGERYQQYILSTIITQLDGHSKRRLTTGHVAELIEEQQTNVLFMFDSVESHRSATRWLKDEFINDLKGMIGKKKVRVVFSGRYIHSDDVDWSNYTLLRLSNFDKSVVQNVIDADRKPQQIETLAREIIFLSGGHPGIIEALVRTLRNKKWIVYLGEEYLRPEDRRMLFRHCQEEIDDAIEDILEGVDIDLRKSLLLLCVFRRYNLDTIGTFLGLASKSTNKNVKELSRSLASFTNIMDLLGKVVKIGLVDPPNIHKPHYSDGPIRNLMMVKMYFEDPGLYSELHRLALETYNALTTTPSDATVPYTAEKFYHFLFYKVQSVSADKTPQLAASIKEELQDYANYLKQSTNFQYYVNLLSRFLQGDDETRNRLRELVGKEGEKAILGVLKA